MQHDITKLCADGLRSYLNHKHGIKLKSGHAHEIVAAFFGYRSKISLLADQKHPLSNLNKAEFILLNPPTFFVDQRLKSLEDLPQGLPASHLIAEGVYSAIIGNEELLEKIQPSFRDLATSLAEDCFRRQIKMLGINPKAINWIVDVEIQDLDAEVLMTVSIHYPTDTGERHRYSKYDIYLPRIAGNLGYGVPKIAETRYSGEARKYSEEELLKKYPIQLQSVESMP